MIYLLLLVAVRRQKWIESSNTMFSLRSWTNALDASGQWRAIYSPPVGEYCFAVLLSHQGFKVHNVTVRQISIPDNIDYPLQASPIKLTTLIVWQSRICPSLVSCRINPSVVPDSHQDTAQQCPSSSTFESRQEGWPTKNWWRSLYSYQKTKILL